jgi:ribosome-associated protein
MTNNESVPNSPELCLDQFLKLKSIVGTGGQAKVMIQGGQVKVNGEVETRRRRKLTPNDLVEVGGKKWQVKESHSTK